MDANENLNINLVYGCSKCAFTWTSQMKNYGLAAVCPVCETKLLPISRYFLYFICVTNRFINTE